MRILFISDNFPPEYNAPATRTFEHCREWVENGAEVTVITGAPNFPSGELFDGYRNRLYQTECVSGINVVRVWSYMAPNAGFARRIMDYLSFAFSAVIAGMFEEFDVVVATSPQFFTTFAGTVLARLRGRPWIFELRDLWPESIIATGSMRPGYLTSVLERIELALYRDAARVVALTDAFKDNLVERGVSEERIKVIPNGVLREDYEVHGGRADGGDEVRRVFQVGYVGTHGLAHGLEVVLAAAALLRDEPFQFKLIGGGARKEALKAEAATMGLSNVTFDPPIPKDEVPDYMAALDVALVPLRKAKAFTTVIPSKIFEAAAAGKPIVLGVEGQAKKLVESYGAGVCVPPEDAAALADCLRRLRADPEWYRSLQQGCGTLADHYDRRRLAREMLRLVREIAEPRGR